MRIARESRAEIKDIEQKMIELNAKQEKLKALVEENQLSANKSELAIKELTSSEQKLKSTLETLRTRKDKVKVVWAGLDENLKKK
jgi:uncharacterized protein YukE